MHATAKAAVTAMCAVLLVSAAIAGVGGAQSAKTVSVDAAASITVGSSSSAALTAQNVEDADGAGSYEVTIAYNESAVDVAASGTDTFEVTTDRGDGTLTIVGYTGRATGPTGTVTLADLTITAENRNAETDIGVTVEEISDTDGDLLSHGGGVESVTIEADETSGETPTATTTEAPGSGGSSGGGDSSGDGSNDGGVSGGSSNDGGSSGGDATESTATGTPGQQPATRTPAATMGSHTSTAPATTVPETSASPGVTSTDGTATEATETSDSLVPGFGPVVAVVAVLAAALLAVRRD